MLSDLWHTPREGAWLIKACLIKQLSKDVIWGGLTMLPHFLCHMTWTYFHRAVCNYGTFLSHDLTWPSDIWWPVNPPFTWQLASVALPCIKFEMLSDFPVFPALGDLIKQWFGWPTFLMSHDLSPLFQPVLLRCCLISKTVMSPRAVHLCLLSHMTYIPLTVAPFHMWWGVIWFPTWHLYPLCCF